MTKKTIGIYFIVNKLNGKYYIGSSKNIERRFTHHRYKLNKNTHTSHYLQRSWNKHGSSNFDFVIVCELLPSTDKSYLNELEQYFLDSADYDNLYNIAKIVGRPPDRDMRKEKHPRYGMHTSESQKQAISLAQRKSGSGIKQVGNIFEVFFSIKGKITYLGSRETYQKALELRLLAEKKYWDNDESIHLPCKQLKEVTGKEGIRTTKYNTYTARAYKDGKYHHVGTFSTFQQAYEARKNFLGEY